MMKTKDFQALIIINESARNGKAGKLWKAIRTDILRQIPGHAIEITYSTEQDPSEKLRDLLESGDLNCIVTAGGDGSMNHLLNFLLELKSNYLDNLTIGGIALGSSNDFIKPCKTRIRNVPVRLDFENYTKNDVGLLKFQDENDKWHTRYFLINASIGVTAEANLLFNEGDGTLNFLKRQYVPAAIYYAALKTILNYKNIGVDLQYHGKTSSFSLSNLAVNKSNYVSGGLRYDQKLKPDDGFIGLNYCYDMSVFELIGTLLDLRKGLFANKKKRESVLVRKLGIHSKQCIAIETDGEIQQGKQIRFSVLPKAIKISGL